jgi:hypothetical protein
MIRIYHKDNELVGWIDLEKSQSNCFDTLPHDGFFETAPLADGMTFDKTSFNFVNGSFNVIPSVLLPDEEYTETNI